MKAGVFLLCLLWLAASAFAGYRLTARSFAWVDLPNFGLPATPAPIRPPALDLNALKGQIPPALLEQAKTLSAQQLLCLQAAIRPDRIQAVLQGQMTTAEAAAAKKCLK